MTTYKTIAAAALIAAAFGCDDKSSEVAAGGAMASRAVHEDLQATTGNAAPDLAPPAGAPAPATGVDALRASGADTSLTMIVRTGTANIRVENVQRAVIAVRDLAARVGGYVANTTYQGGREQRRSATLEIKVPARTYDQAVADLSRIGEIESMTTTAEDVGEEYVDLGARVANSRRLEQRLIGLLASRTGRLQDVLAVERELARVREEIERIEGRMRYLRTRAALSTLTITVHEPEPLHGFDPGDNPIVGALKRAWRNFVGFVAGLIAATGVIVPLAAVGVGAWFGYKRVRAQWPRPRV